MPDNIDSWGKANIDAKQARMSVELITTLSSGAWVGILCACVKL